MNGGEPPRTTDRVAGCGEDRLVAALVAQLPAAGRGVVAGAGDDDCAVVRSAGAKRWQLLKTDCVIEGVHFAPDTPPDLIGWKALCRPLSDLAATGGKPAYALVTLALPADATVDFATGIYAGLARAAREYGVEIVGGETARSPGECFLSVCVTGTVHKGKAVTRGGGRVGDRLFVTGRLGGSFTSGRHLQFQPRLAEARWLVSRFSVRAMMDLSDGLAADLPRLAAASGDGFRRRSRAAALRGRLHGRAGTRRRRGLRIVVRHRPRTCGQAHPCLARALAGASADRDWRPDPSGNRHRPGGRPGLRPLRAGVTADNLRPDYWNCANCACAFSTRSGSSFRSMIFW